MPTGMTTRVVNLYSNEIAVRAVKPGDNVAIRCSLKQEDICKVTIGTHPLRPR